MISGIQTASAITGRNLVAEIRNGAVLGNTHGLTDEEPAWDPLRASTGFHPTRHRRRNPTPRAAVNA